MNIAKQLKDMLGGALGVVGMIVSLLRGGKEGAAAVRPAEGRGPGRKKPHVAKGETGEAKAKHSVVAKKKRVRKPVAAGKASTPAAAGKVGTAAPGTRAKQAAASVSVKGGKKAVASKG